MQAIEPSVFRYDFEQGEDVAGWRAKIPSWLVTLKREDEAVIPVYMPADDRALERVTNRVKDEAADLHKRWAHPHDFKSFLARLQSVYAMTVHTSQGATFRSCFVDVRDISRRLRATFWSASSFATWLRPGLAMR